MKLEECSAGCLLQKYSDRDKEKVNQVYQRVKSTYKNLSNKFRHKTKDYSRQFAHIYAARLSEQRESLPEKIHHKWGPGIRIVKLAELVELTSEKCVIIGTLFKDQELKPSVLKELSEELQLAPNPSSNHFTSPSDKLILEDELQRVMLVGDIDVQCLVTGIICAVLGKEDDAGKFHVEDTCFVGTKFPPEKPIQLNSDRYIVLLSGLDMASNNAQSTLAMELMTDWLTGWLGEPHDQQSNAKVARLIIAGNAVSCSPAPKVNNLVMETFKVQEKSSVLSAVEQLDNLLHQLVSYVPVDLMPGEFDPSNHSLPQQPLHYCMFPKATTYETMKGVTNPYSFELDGRLVTGTSGQPVNDISRFCEVTDPLQVLEKMLLWGHIAPTAPDTLDCYPFYDSDPFILEQQPDIMFAGNQPSFQTNVVTIAKPGAEGENYRTRLVCVPSFSKTRTCVVVNLSTLDCYPMIFDVV